jgi:hypothetical protein
MNDSRIKIRITKELLDGYRPYQIESALEETDDIFYYTAIRHLLKVQSLQNLYERLGEYSFIVIDAETNELIEKGSKPVTTELNFLQEYLNKHT